MEPRRLITEEELETASNLKQLFIKKKRASGITQEKAAHQLGWASAAAVSNYLNAKIPLNLEAGLKFARLLEVKPSAINPEWTEYDPIVDLGDEGVRRFQEHVDRLEKLDDKQFDLIEKMTMKSNDLTIEQLELIYSMMEQMSAK